MAEQWGPWIEHDGLGLALPIGEWALVEEMDFKTGELRSGPCEVENYASWYWALEPVRYHVTRYKTRRHRGMEVLDSILTEIDQPVKEREDA